MCALIEISALAHAYPLDDGAVVHALQGIDLRVDRGEFVALIGRNGSGKSTLARHLNALLLPTAGEVRIDGMPTSDSSNLWAIRERIGMVFQNPENQIVASTVEEDVAFGPENAGLPPAEIRNRVDDALARVGMSAHAKRPPHTLSGGQKQRVAIAGVLAMRSACIILDEPTAMLDPMGRRQTIATIRRLNQDEGITVILITQSMDEAAEARRVVAMDAGRVILDGRPDDVFQHSYVLARAGLSVPVAALIAGHLREMGAAVAKSVLTVEQLTDALC